MNMSSATEKHYRVAELAVLWGFSRDTIARLFALEPGVISLAKSSTGKRRYVSISIPESVASRVHERLGNKALKPALARRNPFRVVRLGDFNRRVPKKARNVLQVHTGEQPLDGESIP
jgi:hypothetical protein